MSRKLEQHNFKLHIKTNNLILRLWGNLCGYIGSYFIRKAVKWGDQYELPDDWAKEDIDKEDA